MKKQNALILCFILICAAPLHAGNGTTSVNFLTQNPSARSVGMGGIFAVSASGAESIQSNPGGLSDISNSETLASFISSQDNSAYGHLAYALPLAKTSVSDFALGSAITYYNAGNIDINNLDGTGKSFNAETGYSFALSAAMRYQWLSLGLSPKWIRSTLVEQFSAQAYALDFGVLLRPLPELLKDRVSFGFALKNLGTKIKYRNQEHDLPRNMGYGADVYLFQHPDFGSLHFSAQGEQQIGEQSRFRLGGEYALSVGQEQPNIFFRAGYRLNSDSDNLSVGLGLRQGRMQLDYAFVNGANLDQSHLFSLTFKFGAILITPKPDPDDERLHESLLQNETSHELIQPAEKEQTHEMIEESLEQANQNELEDPDLSAIKKDMDIKSENELIGEDEQDLEKTKIQLMDDPVER